MTRACDVAMPYVSSHAWRAAYWWNSEITELKSRAMALSRRVARLKCRRGNHSAEATAMWKEYRAARLFLTTAIKDAKSKAWGELLAELEKDPWGKAYQIAFNKLRPNAPPLTECLAPDFVQEVVKTLFLEWEGGPPPAPQYKVHPEWEDELGVSSGELQNAMKRGLKSNTALDPDGILKKVLGTGIQRPRRYIETALYDLPQTRGFPPRVEERQAGPPLHGGQGCRLPFGI